MSGDLHLSTRNLTFSVQQCNHVSKDEDKNIYEIDVVFDQTVHKQTVGFAVRAGSLKVALEIIETLGQQTKNMDPAAFNDFKSKHEMTVFTAMRETGKDEDGEDTATLTLYKDNHANGLKRIFAVSLNNKILKEIHRDAHLWAPSEKGEPKKKTKSSLSVALRKVI